MYLAKLAEQAERYKEMVEFMEKVVKVVDAEELTVEERNLFSVAYNNVIGARKASWRIISSIEQKEESHGNEDHVNVIKEYKNKIEIELSKILFLFANLPVIMTYLLNLTHMVFLKRIIKRADYSSIVITRVIFTRLRNNNPRVLRLLYFRSVLLHGTDASGIPVKMCFILWSLVISFLVISLSHQLCVRQTN